MPAGAASALIVALAALFLAAACRVDPAKSDSTPPVITWNVFDVNANAGVDYPAKATLTAKRGTPIRVALKADDPEGVHVLTRDQGGSSWHCSSGDTASNSAGNLGSDSVTLNPDSAGKVEPHAFLTIDVPMTMECMAGYSFVGGTISLSGTATNYFNGTSTGSLSIAVQP